MRCRRAWRTSPILRPTLRPVVLMAQVALAKSTSFIALLRADGRLLDVTDAPLTSAGLDRHEVIGHLLWQTPWCRHSEDVQADLRRAVELAADGRFARFDVELMLGSAGTVSETVDLVLRPLRGDDGRVAFIVAEGRQVSDRKRAEERIARQNAELSVLTDRLARIHHYRERLLAELSHDLRAPLQIVLTRAERLRRHPRRGAGGRDPGHPAGRAGRARAGRRHARAGPPRPRRGPPGAGRRRPRGHRALGRRAVRRAGLRARHPARSSRRPSRSRRASTPSASAASISNLLANALRYAPAGGVVRCSLGRRRRHRGDRDRRQRRRRAARAARAAVRALPHGRQRRTAAPAPASGWRS